MTCAETKERLVDFLYDELSPEARTAVQEHLHACPSCDGELASFRRTLGRAREALRGPLLEEPPMRVRMAVVEAAQAVKVAVTPVVRTATAAPDEGFFTRLFRAPWFLPAFGAASVATVIFLVRVLKNPEILPGQRPHAIEEKSVSAASPEPGTAKTTPEKSLEERTPARADWERGQDNPTSPRATAGVQGPVARRERLAEKMRERSFAEPPPPRPALAAKAPSPKKKVANDPLSDLSDGDAPPTPAPVVAPAGAPAESNDPAPQPRRAAGAAAPMAASPAAGSAAEARSVGSRGSPEDTDDVLEKTAGHVQREAVRHVVSAEADKSDSDVGAAADDAIRRADRLFAAQDWNAAAESYRELIRRFPRHRDVSRWRERMNTASVAYQRALDAERRKAARAAPTK